MHHGKNAEIQFFFCIALLIKMYECYIRCVVGNVWFFLLPWSDVSESGHDFLFIWGVTLAVFFSLSLQYINLDRHNYLCLVYFLTFIPYLITFLGTISFFSNIVRIHTKGKKCVCDRITFKNSNTSEYRHFQWVFFSLWSMLFRRIQDSGKKM